MIYGDDKRVVMTLDAGGTNFVFSAIQGNREVVEPITLPSNAHDLDMCLATLVEGFQKVRGLLESEPAAISFAFPGPADYPSGIIGDLPNLPAFRGGVALGPMLAERFGLPVFINNDGDLFAYGEAIAGFLPYINDLLEKASSPKRYSNLIGVTLGTGFGCGIVSGGRLHQGDNSVGSEIWLVRNRIHHEMICEESISRRAVVRHYQEFSGCQADSQMMPKDVYEIAVGKRSGNQEAAKKAFTEMAVAMADALANALTLVDGLIVIGGGIAASSELFLPTVVKELNSTIGRFDGSRVPRVVPRVFNLEDTSQQPDFVKGDICRIDIPGSDKEVVYDRMQRTAVGISRLGAATAIAIGAYAFALQKLDQM